MEDNILFINRSFVENISKSKLNNICIRNINNEIVGEVVESNQDIIKIKITDKDLANKISKGEEYNLSIGYQYDNDSGD
ncbi:MAG: hypothetical protein ACOCRK_06330 [bacterium]